MNNDTLPSIVLAAAMLLFSIVMSVPAANAQTPASARTAPKTPSYVCGKLADTEFWWLPRPAPTCNDRQAQQFNL